jgi:hypothetical protein
MDERLPFGQSVYLVIHGFVKRLVELAISLHGTELSRLGAEIRTRDEHDLGAITHSPA